jgi:hypothetical protein
MNKTFPLLKRHLIIAEIPCCQGHEILILIDKNLLWGRLNIQKRKLCVKGILAQDLGFVLGGFSAGIRGILGIAVERGRFQRSGEALQEVLRLIRAHRLLQPVFLIFASEDKHPRDSRGHDKGDRRSWGVERKRSRDFFR